MKNSILKLVALILLSVLSGCAVTYKPINPTTLNYNSFDLQDGIALSYKYDVLRERGNIKYSNKETTEGVKLIAVKISNNTDSVIMVGRDVAFFSGQSQLFPLEPMAIKQSIKQNVPGYLPYIFLTFLNLHITQGNKTDTYPIGLVLGPVITLGNMATAGASNKNMLNELIEYDIMHRDIKKGETVYGIIGIRDSGYVPISLKKIK